MAYLTLIRHAKSSWRLEGLDDAERPLNKRGLGDCLTMPARMAESLPAPDAILSSNAVRTVQTAVVVAAAFDLPSASIHFDAGLYLADAQGMLAACGDRRWRSAGHLMLVGHNPGMTDLYNHLVTPALDNMPTFAVASFELDCGWDELAAFGGHEAPVRLLSFMTPRSARHD